MHCQVNYHMQIESLKILNLHKFQLKFKDTTQHAQCEIIFENNGRVEGTKLANYAVNFKTTTLIHFLIHKSRYNVAVLHLSLG